MGPEDRGLLCVRDKQLQERYVGLESPRHNPTPISTSYVLRKSTTRPRQQGCQKIEDLVLFSPVVGRAFDGCSDTHEYPRRPLTATFKRRFSHARPAPWRSNPSFILSFSLPPVALSCWSKIRCFQRSLGSHVRLPYLVPTAHSWRRRCSIASASPCLDVNRRSCKGWRHLSYRSDR
jgi:hypothetical protein